MSSTPPQHARRERDGSCNEYQRRGHDAERPSPSLHSPFHVAQLCASSGDVACELLLALLDAVGR
jgi:hypothetical protein